MTDDIDPTYDEDFPALHYDPPELNDLGRHYIDGRNSRPVRHKDYPSMARGNGWPYMRDDMDYQPDMDEDRSEHE